MGAPSKCFDHLPGANHSDEWRFVTMATDNPTPLNIETLNGLAARLRDHAEDIAASIEFEPVVLDIRLAARACGSLAGLRFQVAEIAADALTKPALAIHRDLFAALDAAELHQ
jgi:hypothetical protein